jgi:hypothetical protein
LLLAAFGSQAQTKSDTLRFTLHYSENEVTAQQQVSVLVDSILSVNHFNDLDYNTNITSAFVFGHTDSKGSARSNQLLSEKRARQVADQLDIPDYLRLAKVLGFGENQPVASNGTWEGRAANRRVDVMLIYTQTYIPKVPDKDTVIRFEDGSMLKLRLSDYKRIRECLSYTRKTELADIFGDLKNVNYYSGDSYYNFGKVTVSWCTAKCLDNQVTYSLPVPQFIAQHYLPDLRAYVKGFNKPPMKLVKHSDKLWYIDITSRCEFEWIGCGFHCSSSGSRSKKVKVKAPAGYRIMYALVNYGFYEGKRPKRTIRLRMPCPGDLPKVEILATRKNNADTLYSASGTEKTLGFTRRCLNCVDEQVVVRKVLGIRIHKRLLRKKYIFREKDINRKVSVK